MGQSQWDYTFSDSPFSQKLVDHARGYVFDQGQTIIVFSYILKVNSLAQSEFSKLNTLHKEMHKKCHESGFIVKIVTKNLKLMQVFPVSHSLVNILHRFFDILRNPANAQ